MGGVFFSTPPFYFLSDFDSPASGRGKTTTAGPLPLNLKLNQVIIKTDTRYF